MGLTSSRGKRPARLHSSMMGMRLSSMNLRAVSRTRSSSSVSSASKPMKSTPRNFRDMGFSLLLLGEHRTIRNEELTTLTKGCGEVKPQPPLPQGTQGIIEERQVLNAEDARTGKIGNQGSD